MLYLRYLVMSALGTADDFGVVICPDHKMRNITRSTGLYRMKADEGRLTKHAIAFTGLATVAAGSCLTSR